MTQSSLQIRRASLEDAEGIASVLDAVARERIHSAIGGAWTAAEQRTYLASLSAREAFHVAISASGAIVGYQSLDLYSPILSSMAHVGQLGTFLLPEWRRRGVGQDGFPLVLGTSLSVHSANGMGLHQSRTLAPDVGCCCGCLHRCWSARARRNRGHLETAYTRRTRLHGHQPRRWSCNDGDRRIFRHMDSPRSWDCNGWNRDDRRCCPDDDDERQRAALVRARLPSRRPTGDISRWDSLPRQAYARRWSGCAGVQSNRSTRELTPIASNGS
jgi:hypothetical protein